MKIRVKENIRVEITPAVQWRSNPTEEELLDACKDIVKDVKRHIDNIEHVSEAWESKEICSFCKSNWECIEEGVPACCSEAQDEYCKEHNLVYSEKDDKFIPKESIVKDVMEAIKPV